MRITAVSLALFFGTFTLTVADDVQFISYSQYGAVGDGITDDLDAIVKAHAAANEAGLPVRADADATYYIGGANRTALIQTDTDWGNAKFIIDDTNVENPRNHLFNVSSTLPAIPITTIATLKKNQTKLDLSLPYDSFIEATNNRTTHFIRYGPNQNNGAAQTEVFVIDKNGNVDMRAPIIWDFDYVSAMTAYPMDSKTLTVKGGHFTTIANQSKESVYYGRGISVTRSNVVMDGIEHTITGELEFGAPYGGFIAISKCADVLVQNCTLSGHRTAVIIDATGKSATKGTYDILATKAINVTVKNCKQANDIHDTTLWGIFASNWSKNITFDTVEFSRFDAHMGVANATIRNSILGHQGINLIGSGLFLVENTKVCSPNFINLRGDYGSTWEGEIIIRNCEYVPRNGAKADAILIGGSNTGQHNFGYTCFMPQKITIDGLVIHDTNPIDNYRGPKIFARFNSAYTSEEYEQKYPYVITEEVVIERLTIKSGKPYFISDNPFMFRNVKVTEK